MLEVRQMFEPTRLAAACLEAAYARIAPTPWRHTRGTPALHKADATSHEQYVASLSPAREARHG
jgi:hypothetical protein